VVITCKDREYLLSEQKDKWKLSREIGGVKVEYEVPKEAAPDADAVKRYVEEHSELF
jgi:hypothetical protein